MRGDETRVVWAFKAYLEAQGWTVQLEVARVDVLAHRDGETLYAEAKGRTMAPSVDVDTLYGQLLRRMPSDADSRVRFAVVVPDGRRREALRVPARIRALLGIEVYTVSDAGLVCALEEPVTGR